MLQDNIRRLSRKGALSQKKEEKKRKKTKT
jgi:hypothetical protein